MRTFINVDRLRRNRRLSQIFFFVALAVLVSSFVLYWFQPAEQQADMFWFSLIILPLGLVAAITSVRMTNQWIREPRPEEIITEGLKGLGSNYALYHYYLPSNHVVVAPHGIFSITVRFQSGEFRVQGDRWRADVGILARVVRFFRQEHIGKPARDAQREAVRTQVWLDEIVPDTEVLVEPLVVFIHPGATFEAEDPTVPVLYADYKRDPNLRRYIHQCAQEEDRPVLTKAQRSAIEEALTEPDEA